MTQEDKNLLLKVLCELLPYGVMLNVVCEGIEYDKALNCDDIKSYSQLPPDSNTIIKPYLRPMSSMTEEEQRTLDSMCNGVEMVSRLSGLKMFNKAFDWLNAHHFDYRGLIEKDLALEVLADMYK